MTRVCSFCGAEPGEGGLLFRSEIGGEPPAVCSTCVNRFHEVAVLHAASPALAEHFVRVHNSVINRERKG